jgi:hypothetical protein
LNKPDLRKVAEQFRISSEAWREFSEALLPDEDPVFKEARELQLKKRDLFVDEGGAALEEIMGIDRRLEEIRSSVSEEFPLSDEAVVSLREGLAERVNKISKIEQAAIDALQGAMA